MPLAPRLAAAPSAKCPRRKEGRGAICVRAATEWPSRISLECSCDRLEGGVQVGANCSNHRDDRHRNTGSDKPIFNRGCSGFVTEELHHLRHLFTPAAGPSHVSSDAVFYGSACKGEVIWIHQILGV